MSTIRETAAEYLVLRRSTGYKYYAEGLLIGHFTAFLEERQAEHVTVGAVLEWAAMPADTDPAWHAARLTAVRGLIRHLAASDGRHQVPPPGLLPRRGHRDAVLVFAGGDCRAFSCCPVTGSSAVGGGVRALRGANGGDRNAYREAMTLDRGDRTWTRESWSRAAPNSGSPAWCRSIRPSRHGRAPRRDELCPRPALPAFFVSGRGPVSTTTTSARRSTGAGRPWRVLADSGCIRQSRGIRSW